jgi:hypothetical protein
MKQARGDAWKVHGSKETCSPGKTTSQGNQSDPYHNSLIEAVYMDGEYILWCRMPSLPDGAEIFFFKAQP